MALWLVRAGASGEFEKKFLEENRIYLNKEIRTELPLKRIWVVAEAAE